MSAIWAGADIKPSGLKRPK